MEKYTTLSQNAIQELKWWHSNILTANNRIRSLTFDIEIFSDASTTGWGATYLNQKANGLWDSEERNMHINYLEIKAAFLALKCFAKDVRNKQILMSIDNILSTILWTFTQNTKILMGMVYAKRNWGFCRVCGLKENLADEGSRITNIDTEWKLANYAFQKIKNKFGIPTMDLFATRIN